MPRRGTATDGSVMAHWADSQFLIVYPGRCTIKNWEMPGER